MQTKSLLQLVSEANNDGTDPTYPACQRLAAQLTGLLDGRGVIYYTGGGKYNGTIGDLECACEVGLDGSLTESIESQLASQLNAHIAFLQCIADDIASLSEGA